MSKLLTSLLIAGIVGFAGSAIADDSSMQQAQQMKDCMAKQKAANASMTQAAIETVCKNEAKARKTKDGNDLATAPQKPQSPQQ